MEERAEGDDEAGPAEGARGVVRAVVFDLDDTLFLQEEWLRGAWAAVADEARRRYGMDPVALERALSAVAAQGSDRGRIVDRALEQLGAQGVDPLALVDAFRRFRPAVLAPLPGVRDMLETLRRRVPLGLITDGDPSLQEAKIELLGFGGLFDVVILSDVLGRSFRKPHPAPFRQALEGLGVEASEAVYIGDRPDKDVVGALGAGMRVVRVRTGEYADRPSEPEPWAEAPDVLSAVALLDPLLENRPRAGP